MLVGLLQFTKIRLQEIKKKLDKTKTGFFPLNWRSVCEGVLMISNPAIKLMNKMKCSR